MKKMKIIIAAVLAVTVFASLAFTETFRQGDKRITFNPSAIATKTSAYTVTASDSLINVTCSSADITITLPTIASLRPNQRTFKILKTDATVYDVIITPATGDTIGGESTRYLVGQNDYVVISTGPNNDWTVHFESAYTREDYELGTVRVKYASAPDAFGTIVVAGNGSSSWGVNMWGDGSDAMDTGTEVCALAGLTCAAAYTTSGNVPLANCATDVGTTGTYVTALCK